MVGRGGIWDGSLDAWSSMGAAATVRKCSLRQTALIVRTLALAVHDPADKGRNVPQNETDLARAQFNPIRETPFARTAAQSRAMTRRCVFGPAAAGARERISDDAGVPAGPVFLKESGG